MQVAPHRLGHVPGLDPVRIERVVPQAGLMRQAPENTVEQAEAVRVAVQDDAFAQRHEFGGHLDGRRVAASFGIGRRVRDALR